MRGRKVLLTIALLTLATFCLVGTVIAAKILLYKEPGFSGDWDNGTGESPSCAYGEYDEDSGKCVYQSSCAYGEYDEGSGKCQFKRYEVTWQYKDWHEAKSYCEDSGMHLPTIMSDAEHNELAYIADQIGYTWIGFTDEAEEGTWEWVTGEPVIYTHWWDCGEPDNTPGCGGSDADYGMIDYNAWSDEADNCWSLRVVCEWDWESGATGLCPEGYTYQREEGYDGYCYGDPECPEGYEYDQGSGNCIGDPQ